MIYTITLNPALDKTSIVDHLGINQISRIQATSTEAGGKGFNVSRALLRAGIQSRAVGFVGGMTGRELLNDLEYDGLDIIPISIQGDTRVNQVFLEPPSKSIKVNAPGPEINENEYKALIQKVDEIIKSDDICVMSGSLPLNVPSTIYAELTRIVHDKGGKVFLDSSGKAFQEGLNVPPDWIKPNLTEARAVFSGGLNEFDLLEQFRLLGVNGTILTMGSKGLLYSNVTTTVRVMVPMIENENVVGAGDATVAGFVYGVMMGYEPVECAKWAAAFGVASAHAPGNCFDSFDEVEGFFGQLKVEAI